MASHRSSRELDQPDYRYTLANERTFLAWIRTSLTVLAGAVGLAQFGWDHGPRWLRLTCALLLALMAFVTAVSGLVRWRRIDAAIRNADPLPTARVPWLVGLGMIALTCTLIVVIATELPPS